MSVESQDYKLEVLEYAVNQCIDRLLPSSSEDALSVILYQCNEVVWRVATEIYTKSGHQIDFVFVRDILNLRIEPLQRKIAEEERIRREREAEEARSSVEEEKIRKEKEAEQERLRKQRETEKQKKLQKFRKAHPSINIDTYDEFEKLTDIVAKTKEIIAEQLEVEEEQIKLDTLFDCLIPESYNDWRNRMKKEHTWCYSSGYIDDRDLDRVELIMAIEEEFDIEIPDEECDDLLFWNVIQLVNLVRQKLN